jgi:hypothetical protein
MRVRHMWTACVVLRGPGRAMFPSPPRPRRQWLGCGMPASEQWRWGLVYSPPEVAVHGHPSECICGHGRSVVWLLAAV